MERIDNSINGVRIRFASTVNRQISAELNKALKATIKPGHFNNELKELWVSSAKDNHKCPSRHVTGNAVDISRVNGLRIAEAYLKDQVITDIVKGLQKEFENAPSRRENFGPYMKNKNGKNHPVPGHLDHIHFSVNGDHGECSLSIWEKLKNLFSEKPQPGLQKKPEICDL